MPTTHIGVGDFGDDVAQLHESLAAHGFAVPEEERKRKFFGPTTRAAVVKFQTAGGLEPTGHVSGQTAEQLAIPADGIPRRNVTAVVEQEPADTAASVAGISTGATGQGRRAASRTR